MGRLAWTSDLHFDRMRDSDRAEFTQWVINDKADGLIIAGDIGEAPSVVGYLRDLHDNLSIPIYFVLGNHDFYHGSFEQVPDAIRRLVAVCPRLTWLTESPAIPLASTTALIGHDGWADGRNGDYENSDVWPRDFMWIKELSGLSKYARLQAMQTLADEAAHRIREALTTAFESYAHVYLVTHVPPFREACMEACRVCTDSKLPFYTCRVVGEMLLQVMDVRADRRLTVLCGHTHEECNLKVRENLRVLVRDSGYGNWYTPSAIEFL